MSVFEPLADLVLEVGVQFSDLEDLFENFLVFFGLFGSLLEGRTKYLLFDLNFLEPKMQFFIFLENRG